MTGPEPTDQEPAGARGGGRDRRPTMADIARHVGVSRPLVSIVLRGAEGASDATRQRVLRAAAELGYRPDSLAQGLRSNRTRHLGVLFALRRPFEVELVEQMFPVVERLGYHLLLGATTAFRGQEAVTDELLRYRCEGLVVVGPELDGHRLEPVAEEVPVVEIGRRVTRGPVDVVRNDDAFGTRQAVDHLVSLGHRAIAFVDGGDNPGAEDRRAGYAAAMAAHGLAAEARVVPGGYTEDEGAKAAGLLLSDRLPTAVIASNDLSAIGLLDSVLRAGVRVPHELSVVGYDDSRFARLPGIDLTSVRQDVPRMAELAVQAVVERLDLPPREPRDVALPPQLVVRGTTAPPP
ncbi:LacI family transcriptional regulator [Geodermatophilus sp. YIM 151500]|uniref:LacI family DNA-binding transcriptional regulator n=1 Tax=Geodermatophilus sp. YIM 151500 TaxID=2984531 RepID=UPI0021E46DAD|nr:LacI family DNA-binding transcriptional regulator [Geodermatophilus sp. YIM 151500]MCV2489523.1 LacI family transcriptional regulator [Geodermatophilus sp. YIM 151500]